MISLALGVAAGACWAIGYCLEAPLLLIGTFLGVSIAFGVLKLLGLE